MKLNETLNIPQHRLLGEQDDQFDQHHWHLKPSQIMAPQWTSNYYSNIKGNSLHINFILSEFTKDVQSNQNKNKKDTLQTTAPALDR